MQVHICQRRAETDWFKVPIEFQRKTQSIASTCSNIYSLAFHHVKYFFFSCLNIVQNGGSWCCSRMILSLETGKQMRNVIQWNHFELLKEIGFRCITGLKIDVTKRWIEHQIEPESHQYHIQSKHGNKYEDRGESENMSAGNQKGFIWSILTKWRV